MSVLVGRAIPDVRDGLKPVHRRILFTMDELGLQPGKPHKKSARVVGDCLGKYHPHGDLAVYEALVRMAQDFSLRYTLADGQGNFGSVDGDSAAAMRYTESRLSPIAAIMLEDLEKETVNFSPNFDESLKEPTVLPAKLPNLLVNGTSGIAVGMATNMAPHNLTESVDAVNYVIDNPEAGIKDIMKFIPGPDFPTGALICGRQGIKEAYESGRGILTLRAKLHQEDVRGGKVAIIVTEMPYQVNKAETIKHIAELVKDKKISGVSDLRDESDREGMRVYIELKRDTNIDLVLNQLFKHTDLQTSFGINSIALVDGVPKLLNLKELIDCFIKHREEVVTRRTKFDLAKAEHQAHILEGLRIAVSNIDAIIKLIKGSKNPDEARDALIKKFKFSEIQAQAILDLRLQRLTQLERHKIEEDYKAVKELIKELKELLASRKKMLGVIKKELTEIKEKHGDKRKTEITGAAEQFEYEELIAQEDVAVVITRDGFVKRMPVTTFRAQLRGGRGVAGMATREEDEIREVFVASTHSHVLFFTNFGKVYQVKTYELPEAGRTGKGQSIANFLNFAEKEFITATLSVEDFAPDKYLMMVTRKGMIKKTDLSKFANIRKTGIIAINIDHEDELGRVALTGGKDEVIIGTQTGIMIRFPEKGVRDMGRGAGGVRGIKLDKKDKVVCMDVVEKGADLMAITEAGFGKRMEISEFGSQNRGGRGHIAIKLRDKDNVARMMLIHEDDEILFVSAQGTIMRQRAKGISRQGRYAKGVRIQRVADGDYIADMARVVVKAEEETIEKAAKEAEKKAQEAQDEPLESKFNLEKIKQPRRRRSKS
jgi:DNA gyrase subunit A